MSSYQNKIEIKNVSKRFGEKLILKDINIKVEEKQLVAILGPSGSGKSTIFNILTNLIKADSGEVTVNGEIAYMYQKDMLVPWKKIIDNIGLPCIFKGKSKLEARKEVKKYLNTFGLEGYENKYPMQLSGGMKQRANFLKTYLTSSDILLLDEPFGALDSITRRNMQKWLLDLRISMGSTILFITHDIEEAIFLADKVYVISDSPAIIKGVVEVDLPKLRDSNIIVTEKFVGIKKEILNIMIK